LNARKTYAPPLAADAAASGGGTRWRQRRRFRPPPRRPAAPPPAARRPPRSAARRLSCRIFTSDVYSGVTLSVSTDRTQGGSSIEDGSVELMVHRRMQPDDGRGVGNPLNEPGLNALGAGLVMRAVHRLSLDSAAAAPAAGKRAVQELLFRPQLAFSQLPPGASPQCWPRANRANFSGLARALPDKVALVTVHARSTSSVLVRLAQLFQAGEDAVLSAPATVALSTLFAGARLSACEERTLPASPPLADVPVRSVRIEGEGAPSTYPTIPDRWPGPNAKRQTPNAKRSSFQCRFARRCARLRRKVVFQCSFSSSP